MKQFEFNRAIVRTPSTSVVRGLREGHGPDPSLAGIEREHVAYIAALQGAGLTVDILPPLEEFPDAIFVEDPALVFANGAVLLRPGAAARRGEVLALEPCIRERFDLVFALDDGHVDGGDVLVTPERVLIGLSARTNRTGAAALLDLLARLGRRGHAVNTPPGVLHLKSAASLLDEESILATSALAASGIFTGMRVLTLPAGEEGAANALRLNETVLASAAFPRTLEMLDQLGFTVLPLQTTEIAKLDAGISCMSLRWWSGEESCG